MTTPHLVTMVDVTEKYAPGIPIGIPKMGLYGTGTPDVKASALTLRRFAESGLVIIDQSPALSVYGKLTANVADVEAKCGTQESFLDETAERYKSGHEGWIYGGWQMISSAGAAMDARNMDLANTGAWLADWNLNEKEASALIGTRINGIRIVAVQWASPTSNPHDALVPGTNRTLAELNCDVSVALASWYPKPCM